jgi:hypothetical protein
VKLLEGLSGSTHAKRRLGAILETMSGRLGISTAAQRVGVNEARFHRLRRDFLQEALALLEPRVPGRKPRAADPRSEREKDLEREVRELQLALQAARAREEILLALPLKKKRR